MRKFINYIKISKYKMLFKNNENIYENETRGTYNYNINIKKVILSLLLSGTIITTLLLIPSNNNIPKKTFGEIHFYESDNIDNETLIKLRSRYPTRSPHHKRRPFGDTYYPTIDFSSMPIETPNIDFSSIPIETPNIDFSNMPTEIPNIVVTDDFIVTPIIVVNGDIND